MGIITLVGKPITKEGSIFRYIGMAEECDGCNLKDICHKLKPGRKYLVVKVRKVTHPCQVHMDDKVTVVEVEELPLDTSIPKRKALEAALITLDEELCPLRWCENHVLCTLPDDVRGKKATVKKILEELECPRGLKLKRAIIEPKE